MQATIKYFLVAILSLSAGVAFAYPLYYTGYVEPNRYLSDQVPVPDTQKPDIGLDVVYANFTVKPYDPTLPLPSWYNITSRGKPSFLLFDIVTNVTNYSNDTAKVTRLSFGVGNSTASSFSIIPRWFTTGPVEGLWLDGKWVNVTWVSAENGVPEHWRQGVDIKRTYDMGKLVSVSMNINGSWVDVTNRVKLLEKGNTTQFNSNSTAITQLITNGEIRFLDSINSETYSTMDYPWTNVDLASGFSNRWLANQSRLIMLKGVTFLYPDSTQEKIGRLDSNLTIVGVTCFSFFENMYPHPSLNFPGWVSYGMDQITLQTNPESVRVYNNVLAGGQTFQLDRYGVEVFIKQGS